MVPEAPFLPPFEAGIEKQHIAPNILLYIYIYMYNIDNRYINIMISTVIYRIITNTTHHNMSATASSTPLTALSSPNRMHQEIPLVTGNFGP